MSKLIIVCGFPGAGKTTLAELLSKKLNIVCLHKDDIKEELYEILGGSSLEDSKRIGRQSIELLLQLTERQLQRGIDIIIEAPFAIVDDHEVFKRWQEKYKIEIYSVVCLLSDEERRKRCETRERHHSHHDPERVEPSEHSPGVAYIDQDIYNQLPGNVIQIETTKSPEKLLELVLKKIND